MSNIITLNELLTDKKYRWMTSLELEEFIGRNEFDPLKTISYTDWNKIPGYLSDEKTSWIMQKWDQEKQNNMKLEITKERILEAAAKCSTAKETLKTLFPEVFEDDRYFDLTKLRVANKSDSDYSIFSEESSEKAGFCGNNFLSMRHSGTYKYKAFFLDHSYNWEIKKDDYGALCLIPTKK